MISSCGSLARPAEDLNSPGCSELFLPGRLRDSGVRALYLESGEKTRCGSELLLLKCEELSSEAQYPHKSLKWACGSVALGEAGDWVSRARSSTALAKLVRDPVSNAMVGNNSGGH